MLCFIGNNFVILVLLFRKLLKLVFLKRVSAQSLSVALILKIFFDRWKFLDLLAKSPVIFVFAVHLFLGEVALLVKQSLSKRVVLLLNSFRLSFAVPHVETFRKRGHGGRLDSLLFGDGGPLSATDFDQFVE